MEQMSNRIPAEVFPPGEFIRDELGARGWTQQDLAQILRRPLVAVNQIIMGKRAITPETAKGLAAAFGTSAEFWLNMESAYQLSQVETADDEVALRAKLYGIAPVNEMAKRGWIQPSNDVRELEKQLKQFFETDDLDNIHMPVAARKSTSYDELTPPQRAWVARARRLSRAVHAEEYDETRFVALLSQIRRWTPTPEHIRKVPQLLARVGVKLVLVAHLEKTKIDGAAFWVEGQPVVALSLRFDRVDNFWHTLVHELVHIKNRDADVVDSEMESCGDGGSEDEVERRTNEEACAILVPQDKLQSLIIRVRPLYSRTKIIQFAQANGVHPGIVVGQLQHKNEIPPKNLRELLGQGTLRSLIVGQTITDGWGHQPGEF